MSYTISNMSSILNDPENSSFEPVLRPQMAVRKPYYLPEIEFQSQEIPSSYLSNQLPIHSQYSKILETIYHNPVTIISAETGAGKTTQIPNFLLTSYKANESLMNPPSKKDLI